MFHMLTERLSCCMVLFEASNVCKIGRGDQSVTWQKRTEILTSGLSFIQSV